MIFMKNIIYSKSAVLFRYSLFSIAFSSLLILVYSSLVRYGHLLSKYILKSLQSYPLVVLVKQFLTTKLTSEHNCFNKSFELNLFLLMMSYIFQVLTLEIEIFV